MLGGGGGEDGWWLLDLTRVRIIMWHGKGRSRGIERDATRGRLTGSSTPKKDTSTRTQLSSRRESSGSQGPAWSAHLPSSENII